MLQLGMDAEGSAMRAKMQSAALLSDMESFKAANPGCTLGDFVRWHSPRDWEEKGNGKVRLYIITLNHCHTTAFKSKPKMYSRET